MPYAITLTGATTADVAQVKHRLAALHKVPVAQVDRFFTGRPVVVKTTHDAEAAHRIHAAYTAAGAVCRIDEVSDARHMTCPKCGFQQPHAKVCQRCKVIVDKYQPTAPATPPPTLRDAAETAKQVLADVAGTVTSTITHKVTDAKTTRPAASPQRRQGITYYLLLLFAGGAFALGLWILSISGTALQEIEGMLVLIMAAVFFSGVSIIDAISRRRD